MPPFCKGLFGRLAGLWLIGVLLVPGEGRCDDPGGIESAEPAPALRLPDLSRESHDLSSYRGELVLINFWASWCPPCLMEMSSLQRLQTSLSDRPFRVLAVNVRESRSRVWQVKQMLRLDLTMLLDHEGAAAADWGVDSYPTSYLVDGKGEIRRRFRGALEWDTPEARHLVDGLIPDNTQSPAASATPTADRAAGDQGRRQADLE